MSKILNVNGTKQLTPDQVSVVDLLKEALALALEGKVTSVGVVLCMEKGFSHVTAGREASNLNLGCDAMKAEILARASRSGAGVGLRAV